MHTIKILLLLISICSGISASDLVSNKVADKCDEICRISIGIMKKLQISAVYSKTTSYHTSDDNLGTTSYSVKSINNKIEKVCFTIDTFSGNGAIAELKYPLCIKDDSGKVIETIYRITIEDEFIDITYYPNDLPDGFLEKLLETAKNP